MEAQGSTAKLGYLNSVSTWALRVHLQHALEEFRRHGRGQSKKCETCKISLWNCNSITIIQQHLNVMQSTYKLLTSDFVVCCVKGFCWEPKDQNSHWEYTVAPLTPLGGTLLRQLSHPMRSHFGFYEVRCQQFVIWPHNIQVLLEWLDIRIPIFALIHLIT